MTSRTGFVGGCVAAMLLSGAAVRADVKPASTSDSTDAKLAAMEKQMLQMQSQLTQTQKQLKQTQSQLQQTQQQLQKSQAPVMTPQEQAAMVKQILDDADKHTAMLTEMGVDAGYDPETGYFIQSDDGNTVVHPGLLFDAQDYGHPATGGTPGSAGNIQFSAWGSLFSKDLTYRFVVNNGDVSRFPGVEELWVQYDWWHNAFLGHDIEVRVGQYKNPAFKESSLIGDPYLLLMSNSLASDLIGGGAQGPEVRGGELLLFNPDSPWEAEFSADGGPAEGLGTTDPEGDYVGNTAANVSARFDYKFFGDWADTTDLTGHQWGQKDLLDVGGGADYRDAHNALIYLATADVQYQSAQNWTIFGAVYGQHMEFQDKSFGVDALDDAILDDPGFGPGARNDWGVDAEAGYNITKPIQIFGRYSLTRTDVHLPVAGESIFHELSLGVNYFFGPDGSWANHAKFTIEFDYLPNGTPANADSGYLASPNGKPQRQVRGQVQFFF